MKKFLALTLMLRIVKKPEISDYWSTNALLKGSVFNSVIPETATKQFYGFCILLITVDLTRMTQTMTGFTKLDQISITWPPSSSPPIFQQKKSQKKSQFAIQI